MLPGPYESWTAEILGRPFPTEQRATCSSCAMRPEAPDLPAEGPFHPDTRCCTYQPHLPPYLVGALLGDAGAPGRDVVRARIAARAGVTPHGVGPTPAFSASYQRLLADPRAFGRSLEIACPYLDGAGCGIWRHRGMACAVYHCKFDRGALGAGLWNLLGVVYAITDRALRRWLLRRHDLDPEACDALLRDPSADARAWGGWLGREEAYFTSCAAEVAALSWPDVVRIGGVEIARLADALRAAWARLEARALPERVRRGAGVLVRLDGRLHHPGVPNDPLAVAPEVARLLAELDEAPLGALAVDEALARKLLDWQALVPVTPPSA
jgi:hypothetical protein